MIEPFLSAIPVLTRLEEAGFEAYFVGGAVRDFLLEKPIHDVDIATSATPAEMKKIFSKTIDIGIEHGTILVLFQNHSYEITTFRAESEYVDYRRPKEVTFIRSLQKDLERRDFTINAIAMDRNGGIHDPFDGRASLRAKEIKTVGGPEERFREDALRMMRAVRFMSQLNFQIEQSTRHAIADFAYLLKNIAVERKRMEFEKLLTGVSRLKALRLILDSKLYLYLPSLANKEKEMTKLLQYDCKEFTLMEMWVLLLYCLELKGKEAENFLRDWRLSVNQIKKILHHLSCLHIRLDHEWTKVDLYIAKLETIISVEKMINQINKGYVGKSVGYWTDLYQKLPIHERGGLGATGRDLMAWTGKEGGPWINQALIALEHAVLSGKLENEKTKIKEWLLKCNLK